MTRVDCLVIGGGPAGAAATATLLRRGRTVALVDDGRKKHAFPIETLLPGARPVIERCGFEGVFAAQRAFGFDRRGVVWGSDDTTWREPEDAQRGFSMQRGPFDSALQQTLSDRGAVVFAGHRVRSRLPDDGRGEVSVESHDGTVRSIETDSIVVAAGRGEHRALFDADVVATGPETTTLSFVGATEPDLGQATLVEAVAEGWLWWIPVEGDCSCVAVFLDTDEVRERGTDALVADGLSGAKATRLAEIPETPEYGANGTARLVRPRSRVILCGDAAATLDPLSSQGVETAMSSGEHAALVVDTMLRRPGDGAALLDYQHAWERRLWRAHLRETGMWYAREERFVDRAFWRARRAEPGAGRLGPDTEIVRDERTEPTAAFERRGEEIVCLPGYGFDGTSLATIGPAPIDAILRLIQRPASVREVLTRAGQDATLFPLSPRLVVDALQLLVDEGLAHEA